MNYGKRYFEEAPADGEGGAPPANTPPADTPPADTPPASWRDGLSADYKDAPALKDFADLNAFAKSHLELNRLRGQSIRVPTEEAGDDAWSEFYSKLTAKVPGLTAMPNPDDEKATKAFWAKAGVPDSLEGYKVPDGVNLDNIAGLNELAQKAGLTAKQFAILAKEADTKQGDALALQQSDHKAAMDKLDYEWGLSKDNKMAGINLLLKNSDAPDTLKEAVATGNVGPEFLRWADGLVKAIGAENNSLTVDQTKENGALTPSEAQGAIDEIMANKDGAYWNNRDPMHKATVDKVIAYKRMVIAGRA